MCPGVAAVDWAPLLARGAAVNLELSVGAGWHLRRRSIRDRVLESLPSGGDVPSSMPRQSVLVRVAQGSCTVSIRSAVPMQACPPAPL